MLHTIPTFSFCDCYACILALHFLYSITWDVVVRYIQRNQIPVACIASKHKMIQIRNVSTRMYANSMVCISDMLRRLVAAHNTGEQLRKERVLEMEQAAAAMTRLGVHKLQQMSARAGGWWG